MKLWLVRHGETIENANDIIMGHNPGTLSEKGVLQAEETADKLKGQNFDQAWSSDLKRCVDTAKVILKFHPNLDLQLTPALREVNYGTFQGKPGEEIRAYFDAHGGFSDKSKAPNGESHIEMRRRVIAFINKLIMESDGKRVLIVSHNGPIEAIREAVEGTPFSGDSLNASIKTFEIDEPLKL